MQDRSHQLWITLCIAHYRIEFVQTFSVILKRSFHFQVRLFPVKLQLQPLQTDTTNINWISIPCRKNTAFHFQLTLIRVSCLFGCGIAVVSILCHVRVVCSFVNLEKCHITVHNDRIYGSSCLNSDVWEILRLERGWPTFWKSFVWGIRLREGQFCLCFLVGSLDHVIFLRSYIKSETPTSTPVWIRIQKKYYYDKNMIT